MAKNSTYVKAFKSVFFLACLTFVLWQCYSSFSRYLEKPISIFKFIDSATNWPLPKITICPPLDSSTLSNCGISPEEWNNGKWTGQQNEYITGCTDSIFLLKKALATPDKFVKEIEISTFDGENIRLDWSDDLPDPTFKTLDFIYDPENFEEDGKNPLISSCFELIYPKRLQLLGIQTVNIVTKYQNPQEPSYITINPPGYLQANPDIKKKNIDLLGLTNNSAKYLSLDLVHQIDNFLKIGDENCIPDSTYNRDDCVNEQIRQYSLDLYGCAPPSLVYYDHKVCNNGTSSMMQEIFKLIECDKPCSLFKMEIINERGNLWENYYDNTEKVYSAKISVSFKELITISKDQFSYTWLNFLAEVGGYVGLFLGYSVFQATSLIDTLLRDICKIL